MQDILVIPQVIAACIAVRRNCDYISGDQDTRVCALFMRVGIKYGTVVSRV